MVYGKNLIQADDNFWSGKTLICTHLILQQAISIHPCLQSFYFYTGISSLDNNAGKMGVQALIYYMLTTIIAVFTGIILVLMLQPGKRGRMSHPPSGGGFDESLHTTDALLDLIRSANTPISELLSYWCLKSTAWQPVLHFEILSPRNMFPSNLVETCFKQVTFYSDYLWFILN